MSAHRRFLLDPSSFDGDRASITGAAAHQIIHVLRLSVGDGITLLDGSGLEYDAVITRTAPDAVEALVQSQRLCASEPRLRLVVAVCVPKGDKMDLVVQKCTELGAAEIVPVTSSRTVVGLDSTRAAARLTRWRKIACEAVEQSGRARSPEIRAVVPLSSLLADPLGCDFILVAWESEDRLSLREALEGYAGGSVMLIVGPEGGFTESEIEQARAAGAKCVSLGRRRLRTETAAIAGAAAVLFALDGEL